MKSRRHAMAYQNAERQAFAESDDPHALIAILFDELLRQMKHFAREAEVNSGKNLERSEHYSRALTILYVLQSSLNFEEGGEIANNLSGCMNIPGSNFLKQRDPKIRQDECRYRVSRCHSRCVAPAGAGAKEQYGDRHDEQERVSKTVPGTEHSY